MSNSSIQTHGNGTAVGAIADLFVAAKMGTERDIERILANGADPNGGDDIGNIPLHVATHRWTSNFVYKLLAAGSEVDERDGETFTPLMWTANEGNECSTFILIKYGADVNATTATGHSVLMNAVYNCHLENNRCYEVAKLLIEAGADVSTEAKDGTTALSTVLRTSRTRSSAKRLIKLLKDNGSTES